ncbi:MAG TPA: hypothetical protein VMT34_07960 [Aggregatilineales bacterium]|nr:hypothetical protein [Aggregatilineales bacterium]
MSGAPRIARATLDETELRRILMDHAAALPLIYLESSTRIVLRPTADFLGPKITLPPIRWLVGRAFGPTLEIRWALREGQFAATALTESVETPPTWTPSPWMGRLDPTTRPRDILLYGTNVSVLPPGSVQLPGGVRDGVWVDERIPRFLDYPLVDPKAQHVVLRGVDYTSRGIVVITRFCELAPLKE